MTLTDDLALIFARAARGPQPTLNGAQARAAMFLMAEGLNAGPNADPPPTALLLCAIDARSVQPEPVPVGHVNAAGELELDPPEPNPDGHTVLAIAEDGRAWSLVAQGIAWPLDADQVDARGRLAADPGRVGA